MSIRLNPQQQNAVDMALSKSVSLLAGYAGTGKTTTLTEILRQIVDRHPAWAIRCAAPTGKAAKRMEEVTGFEASTIHRLLEPNIQQDGSFNFSRSKLNPLNGDFFILDECSMIGASLFASFMDALPHGAKLLCVGDPGQLQPVSPGVPFHDMLGTHIPKIVLSEIFRNSGAIVQVADAIRSNRMPSKELISKKIDIDAGINFRHFEIGIDGIYGQIKALIEWAASSGFDPIWDAQIISPINEKTDLSCKSINEFLRFYLLPSDDVKNAGKFRIGEKVIQTKNDMLPDTSNSDEHYVVNGDIGEVIGIEKSSVHVRFFNPPRECICKGEKKNLKHAFAITCHKMQGSEAPIVIIPVHKSISYIINNPWVYTAITRGRKVVFTVGEWSVIERGINIMMYKRSTFLKQKIMGDGKNG